MSSLLVRIWAIPLDDRQRFFRRLHGDDARTAGLERLAHQRPGVGVVVDGEDRQTAEVRQLRIAPFRWRMVL